MLLKTYCTDFLVDEKFRKFLLNKNFTCQAYVYEDGVCCLCECRFVDGGMIACISRKKKNMNH